MPWNQMVHWHGKLILEMRSLHQPRSDRTEPSTSEMKTEPFMPLLRMEVRNGHTKWMMPDTNKSILSSPAIDLAGNLFFGSGNGYCYSISDDGSSAVLNWKVSTNDRVDTSPVLGENNDVIFVSRDGYLRSIDINTGITNWDAFTGDVFYSSPVVDSNGRIYVIGYTGFGENHMFAFESNGTTAWDTNQSSSPLTIGGIVDSLCP